MSPQPCRRPRRAARDSRAARGTRAGRRGERGAVLVHVAVAMIGCWLLGAVDRPRRRCGWRAAQAQNAADAGALAGARRARLRRSRPTAGRRRPPRRPSRRRNRVWGDAGRAADDSLHDDAPAPCPAGAPATPVRARRRLPRPGVAARRCRCSSRASSASTDQGVRATATAQGAARQRDAACGRGPSSTLDQPESDRPTRSTPTTPTGAATPAYDRATANAGRRRLRRRPSRTCGRRPSSRPDDGPRRRRCSSRPST